MKVRVKTVDRLIDKIGKKIVFEREDGAIACLTFLEGDGHSPTFDHLSEGMYVRGLRQNNDRNELESPSYWFGEGVINPKSDVRVIPEGEEDNPKFNK